MTNIQKIECMECGKIFERDMDDPKVKKEEQVIPDIEHADIDCQE
jgi:DNA-directed RNA polymerase subunit RPC12/RpoP